MKKLGEVVFLYKFNESQGKLVLPKEFVVKIFKPNIYALQKHGRFSLIYVIWYLFTLGKYQIIYIYDKNNIIHYSHIIPKFWKFQFMERDDLEIGPSWTHEEYRGQGIYPYVLNYIINKFEKNCIDFYMIVNKTNIKSIKGIEKSGFLQVGELKKSKVLGVYSKL